MSYQNVPLDALVTTCLSTCKSRIRWEYDAGERTTRDYPGYPESVTPYDGCSVDHLKLLDDSLVHKDQVWYLLRAWWMVQEGASRAMLESRIYLGLKPFRGLKEALRNRDNRLPHER